MKFLLLLGCGLISVAATPRTAYVQGTLTRDFITAWVLPVAILLPPVYAMVTPIPLLVLTQWRIHKGVIFRRVFTAAAMGLAYGAASLVFHAFPASIAGPAIGKPAAPVIQKQSRRFAFGGLPVRQINPQRLRGHPGALQAG